MNYNDNKCSKVGQIFCAPAEPGSVPERFSAGPGQPRRSTLTQRSSSSRTCALCTFCPRFVILLETTRNRGPKRKSDFPRNEISGKKLFFVNPSSEVDIKGKALFCSVLDRCTTLCWWYGNINYGIKMKGCPCPELEGFPATPLSASASFLMESTSDKETKETWVQKPYKERTTAPARPGLCLGAREIWKAKVFPGRLGNEHIQRQLLRFDFGRSLIFNGLGWEGESDVGNRGASLPLFSRKSWTVLGAKWFIID